jgi:hypothetical protein
MSAELRRFAPDELYLNQEQAWRVIRFFWPETDIAPGSLSDNDRQFAQGLLIEAIDSSYQMGFVEIIFRTFAYKVAPSFDQLKDMVKSFVKKAAKHWFRHATGKDLQDPQIYESIRKTIARNFRTVWVLRMQTGELTY